MGFKRTRAMPAWATRCPRRAWPLAILCVFLLSPGSFPAERNPSRRSDLLLGFIQRDRAADAPAVSLERAVAEALHDYGPFVLARFTHEQAEALRGAGYAVRVFEDPERVGLGHYAFRVPPGPAGLPPHLTVDESGSERGTYLVKMIGPATDAWLDEIRALGGEILTPIPQFTYLVRAHPRQRGEIAGRPYVEWVGPYHPAFKLGQDLPHKTATGTLSREPARLNVLVYRSSDVDGVVNRIRGMGGEILDRTPFDFYEQVLVLIPERSTPDLARLPDVYAVDPYREPRLEDESSTQILAGQVGSDGIPFRPLFGDPTYNDWLAARGLDGSNVTIGYSDDGVLNSDPSDHLDGRVNESVCGTPGTGGHGHFGAATAGGACTHPGEESTGYRLGLGVAPAVNFISLPFLKSSGACTHNDAERARDTVINRGPNGIPGTIQNNSWGAGSGDGVYDGTYGSLERTFDILTRDADSVAAGNQPLITCFSAGNEGNSTLGSGGDSPATLTRPHVAKNILTTGSSSVYRPSRSGDNIDDRSLFSSQGPTFDGRIKPDFMAPGGAAPGVAAIASALTPEAITGGICLDVGDGLHCLSAGTSFSSPQTAGGAALLVQWWQRFASAVPSPAMAKALLVNSARDMEGGNTSAPLGLIPNRWEGWGRWNLGNLIEAGTPTVVADGPILKKTSGLDGIYLDQSVVFHNIGDQFQLRLIPADAGQPLRATLAWTDAPAAVDSCPSLVNDLDLELVQDGKTVLRGNAFTSGVTSPGGPADARNNVEQVIQANPSAFYTLTVRAVMLAGDGIPSDADATDQDFALVVTNAIPYTGPILAAGTVTWTDGCAGTGAGNNTVIDPGETVTFSVPLANSGNAAATAVSGSLSTSAPGVSVLDGSVAYPDIATGVVASPGASDTLSIAIADTVLCGTGVDLTLDVSTAQGSFSVPVRFDVGSRSVSTQNLPGTTGVVPDDVTTPGNFVTPSAAAGALRSVSVDVNIATSSDQPVGLHLFNNFDVSLIAPSGTSTLLHANPLPCTSLVASYPSSRLAQAGDLGVFQGENAAGSWTLRVVDRNNTICVGGGPPRACSEATVNAWAVHLTTESAPACNTCIAAPPPEVSGPGSVMPLTVDLDSGTGNVTLDWEDLGSLVDSYRLYQGSIGALAGIGVTPSNTAPIQCGILPPTSTFLPDGGDLFWLVAGQKGSLTGPLGDSSDPSIFPRSASQTCP